MLLYGRSLSFCVSDILRGKVAIEDVGGIVAGTSAVTKGDWDRLTQGYATTYWSEWSWHEITTVVLTLKTRGLIYQPRIMDGDVQQDCSDAIWADSLGGALGTLQDMTRNGRPIVRPKR